MASVGTSLAKYGGASWVAGYMGGGQSKSDDSHCEPETDKGDNEMSLFETKEELAAFIAETVKVSVKGEIEVLMPPKTKSDEERLAEAMGKLEKLGTLADEMTALKSEITALTTKTESLEHATIQGQTGGEDEVVTPNTTKGEESAWSTMRPIHSSTMAMG